jgi:hypothetical protein
VVRSRRITEVIWKGQEVLQNMYEKCLQKQCGKVKKNYRSCIKKTRPQKLYGNNQKYSRRLYMKVTTEVVCLDPEELKKLYGKNQKN